MVCINLLKGNEIEKNIANSVFRLIRIQAEYDPSKSLVNFATPSENVLSNYQSICGNEVPEEWENLKKEEEAKRPESEKLVFECKELEKKWS